MEDQVQSDFPIDWEQDGYVSRREFFKFVTLASGGFAAGSAGLALWANLRRTERQFDPVPILGASSLQPGNALPFEYPRPKDLCLLIRQRDGSLKALHASFLSSAVPARKGTDLLSLP